MHTAARVTVKAHEPQDCHHAYTVEVKDQFDILTPYNSTHSTKAPSMGDSVVFYSSPQHCPECPKLEVNGEYLIAGSYRKEEDGSVTWRLNATNDKSLVSLWVSKYDRKLSNWINSSNMERHMNSLFQQNCENNRQLVSAEQWSTHE